MTENKGLGTSLSPPPTHQHQMDFDEDKDGDFHDRALQGGCCWFCSSWIWSEMRCMSSYAVYGLMSNIKRPTRSQHLVVNRSQTQRLCRTNLLWRKPRRAVVLLRVTRLLFQRFLIGFTLLLLLLLLKWKLWLMIWAKLCFLSSKLSRVWDEH